jgi:hypothetical protein
MSWFKDFMFWSKYYYVLLVDYLSQAELSNKMMSYMMDQKVFVIKTF